MTIDMDTQTIKVKWPEKTVTFSFVWQKGDVMKGASRGDSLGPGGDLVEISPMSDVIYRCMGFGVPYIGAFKLYSR